MKTIPDSLQSKIELRQRLEQTLARIVLAGLAATLVLVVAIVFVSNFWH